MTSTDFFESFYFIGKREQTAFPSIPLQVTHQSVHPFLHSHPHLAVFQTILRPTKPYRIYHILLLTPVTLFWAWPLPYPTQLGRQALLSVCRQTTVKSILIFLVLLPIPKETVTESSFPVYTTSSFIQVRNSNWQVKHFRCFQMSFGHACQGDISSHYCSLCCVHCFWMSQLQQIWVLLQFTALTPNLPSHHFSWDLGKLWGSQ